MTDQTTEWNEMATDFVSTWTETGSQMWKSWFDMMGAIPTPVGDIRPELEEATRRYFDNRELLVKFLQLSIDAWKDIFPIIETGDDWQTVLNKYTETMRRQLDSFRATTVKTSEDVSQLWKIYLQQVQKFNQLWLDPLGMSNGIMAKAFSGNTSALIEFNNLYSRLFDETFGNGLQAPLLGLPREINRKLIDGFEAWRTLYQASTNYQIILADIQVKSFEALMKKLVSLTEEGKPVKDWRQFQDLWSVVADEVFETAFRNPENLKIRGQFINSLNSYRIKQQELMELYLKSMNLPSRSEVDEIHKTIYELRKEVKSLKKALTKKELETSHLESVEG